MYFGQTLCSDVIALHSEMETAHLRPAEDQRQAGKVRGCLSIGLAVFFPIIRPIHVFQSLLYYFSKEYSIRRWQSGKGHENGKKRGLCVLETEEESFAPSFEKYIFAHVWHFQQHKWTDPDFPEARNVLSLQLQRKPSSSGIIALEMNWATALPCRGPKAHLFLQQGLIHCLHFSG